MFIRLIIARPLLAAVLGCGLALGVSAGSAAADTFTFTDAPQYYTVPSGVYALSASATGGGGGNGNSLSLDPSGAGGSGAVASADVAVKPGDVLEILVGGQGANGSAGYPAGGLSSGTPWAGGAGGSDGNGGNGGGGGGATEITDTTTPKALVVAGGGGGGGAAGAVGSGGAGGSAGSANANGDLGDGANPGVGGQAAAGAQGGGGNGAGSASSPGGSSGGGGGGFYLPALGATGGGGAGGSVGGYGGGAPGGGGGGGGASYTDPAAAGTSITTDSTAENGSATISVIRVLSTSSLTASVNPATAGQPVTFTAQVHPPAGDPTATGTVNFSQTSLITGASTVLGTDALNGSGVASYTTSSLAVGANVIYAAYNGDGNYVPVDSPYVTEKIQPAPSATTLKFNPAPVVVGHSYTVTANVASTTGQAPTGTVTFYSEGNEVSTVALNGASAGVATITAPTPTAAGPVTWQAVYNGDANDSSSQSAVFDETANATTTTLTFGPDPVTVAHSYTVTATVAAPGLPAPTGTVTFYSEGNEVSTVALNGASPGVAKITAPAPSAAGPVTWQVVYSGGDDSSSQSAVVDQTAVAATG